MENERGDLVRSVHFGRSSTLAAQDWPYELALRDVWRVNERLQLDGGTRIDGISRYGALPSARVGFRFALDDGGATVVKGGVGNFVGKIPLSLPAFAGYPTRTEWMVDEATGRDSLAVFQPTVGRLRMPHAVAVTLQLERQILPGLTRSSDSRAGARRAWRRLKCRPRVGTSPSAAMGRAPTGSSRCPCARCGPGNSSCS